MTKPLRLGIAGLGTVGVGVIKIIQNKLSLLKARTGKQILISAVTAKSKTKDRGIDLSSYQWERDPVSLANREDIDVFIELIGGHEGAAKEAVEIAISKGKNVVTANKALLAHHGHELALKAEENGSILRFEAAVAGGIPVIKSLTEGLAGNSINRIMGVMNGTCNYILTRMESSGLSYEEVFSEANELGYLEADPNLDIGGIDAAHKLSILSSIAFGTEINFNGVELDGIDKITINDIHQAADMGFRIKLLGVSQMTSSGLEQRMSPCLVPTGSPLGQLEGGTNMIVMEGDQVGQIVLRGAGAGEGPTASAVVSDITDIARGISLATFGQPAKTLKKASSSKSQTPAPYYLRMLLHDEPGALAKITKILSQFNVSIDRMRQYGHEDENAPVLIVTHEIKHEDLMTAIQELPNTQVLKAQPLAIRIEAVCTR
jgi:homoserine dehydrogenase